MITIALADDHRQVREIWSTILAANHGLKLVATCANGQEAIKTASALLPHIFLMDINMAPVNGIEATGRITVESPGVKVIGMSMHVDTLYVSRMLKAGAMGYVTKNSPFEEVLEAIATVHKGEQYICREVKLRQSA